MGSGKNTQLQSDKRKQDSLKGLFGNSKKNLIEPGIGLFPQNPLQKPVQDDSLKQLSEGNQAYYERMLTNSRNVQLVSMIRNREEIAGGTKGDISHTAEEGFEVYDLSTEVRFRQKLPVAQKDDKGHNLEQGALKEAKSTFESADLCTTRELTSMKQYFSNWKSAEGPAYTGNDVPGDPALTEYVNSILSFELTLAVFTDDYMSQHMPQLYEYSRKLAAYDRMKKAYPKFFESLPESSKMKLEMCADMKDELRDILNEHMAMHGLSLHTDAKNKEDRVTLRKESKDKKTRELDRKTRKESYENKLKNFFRGKIDGYNVTLAKRYISSYPDKETDPEKIDLKELQDKIQNSKEAFEVCGNEMNAAVNEIKKATAVRNELVGRQKEYTRVLDESNDKIQKLRSDLETYQEGLRSKEKKGGKLTAEEQKSLQEKHRIMTAAIQKENAVKDQMRRNIARTNRRLRIVNEHIDCYREFISFGMGETDSVSPETAGFIEREGHEDMLMLIRFRAAGDCIEKTLAVRDMSDKLASIAKLRKEKDPAKKEMAAEKASALEQEFRENLSYVKMSKDQFYKKLKEYREANKDKNPVEDPVMTLLRDDRVAEDVMGVYKLLSDESNKEINSILAAYTKKALGYSSSNPDKRTDRDTGDLRSYISGNLNIMIKSSLKGGNTMKAVNPQQYSVMQGDPITFSLPQIKRDKYGQIDASSMDAYWRVKEDTEDYFSGDQERVNNVLQRIGRDMLKFTVTDEMKKNTDRYLDTNGLDYDEHKSTLIRAKGFRALYIKHRDYFESDAFTREEREKLHKELLDNNDLTFILAVAETYKVPFAANPDGERIKETEYEKDIRMQKEEEERKRREEEEKKKKDEEENEIKKEFSEEEINKLKEYIKKRTESGASDDEAGKALFEKLGKKKEKKYEIPRELEKAYDNLIETEKKKEEEKKKKEEEEKKQQQLKEEEEKKKRQLKEEEERKKQLLKEEEERKKQQLKEEEERKKQLLKEEEERKKKQLKEEEEKKKREEAEKKEKEEERRREAERQFSPNEREMLLRFWSTLKNIGDAPKSQAVKKVYQKFFEKLNANLVPESLKKTWERVQDELVKQGEEEFQLIIKEREEAKNKKEAGKKPEIKKKTVDFRLPPKPALSKEQKAGLYTEENKKTYEEKLRQAKLTVPADIEQLNLERSKFQHPEYFLTADNKWTVDYVYNKGTNAILMECYEWLMQYYRYQIELEEGVTSVISKVQIPKYAKTEVKQNFKYEHQQGENCWCCAGTALLRQFLATQGKQTDKEISQYAMRQFKPEKKTLEDIHKGGQPQVEQAEYEQYISEADRFIGKQKGDNSGVGSIYEAADFFYQYTDDFALNRMLFTIPGKKNQLTYTDSKGYKKTVYADKTKNDIKRDELIINNQKAAFVKQVKTVLDTGNLVAMLIQTPYRHYVTIKGIEGTKITYLDSLKTDAKKETTEDIGRFIKHFDQEAKQIELTWFSPLKTRQEMQAEFKNLKADASGEEYEVKLTNEAAHNVYQTKGVSVGKRTVDMGENMHQISHSVYIPKKIKKN